MFKHTYFKIVIILFRNSGDSRRGRLSEEGVPVCRHTDSGRSSDSSISSAQRRKQVQYFTNNGSNVINKIVYQQNGTYVA